MCCGGGPLLLILRLFYNLGPRFCQSLPTNMTPDQIRSLRTRLQLGQAEFAQMLGVHPMTVSRWEREKGALSPTAYQEVWMKEFETAVTKDKDVGNVLKGVLIGAGIAAAIFLLLGKSRG